MESLYINAAQSKVSGLELIHKLFLVQDQVNTKLKSKNKFVESSNNLGFVFCIYFLLSHANNSLSFYFSKVLVCDKLGNLKKKKRAKNVHTKTCTQML